MSKPTKINEKFQSLVDMCDSKFFKIDMLLHHLIINFEEEELRDCLIKKFNRYTDKDILFYVPQLVNLFLWREVESIREFLMERTSRNLNFYLLVSWCIEAWGLGFGRVNMKRVEAAEEFLEDCENNMVNCISETPLKDGGIEEMMMAKEARSDFKNDVRRFLSNLVNFSLFLKKSDKDEREIVGRKFLNNMNGWLYRRKVSTKKIKSRDHNFFYEGILFPFEPTHEHNSSMIVRIIHSEISCFETKMRVPYKMVVETIDPEELKEYTPDFERDPDFEGYLYLYDSDVIEEELVFEELLKQERIEADQIVKEQNDEKKAKIKNMRNYAKKKFKKEKEKTSMFGKFKKKGGLLFKKFGKNSGEHMTERGTGDKGFKRMSTVKPKDSTILKTPDVPIKERNWARDGLIYRKRTRERRRSLNYFDDYPAIEAKINFFRRLIFPKVYKGLNDKTKLLLKDHYDELCIERNNLKQEIQKKASKTINPKCSLQQKGLGPWSVMWSSYAKSVKKESPYGHFPSYKLRPILVKGGDDLRQELITMQLIKKCKEIFENEHTSLWTKSYEIVVTTSSSGIIEFIPDTISIDGLKKRYKGCNLTQIYKMIFGYNFEEAQKNFVESLAASSLICYILQIKDRHNGNIMIDSRGHIFQIDFGFILTQAPGGTFSLENAPFKLTNDYITLMGGLKSGMFAYYKVLIIQGFLALRKYVNEFCDMLEVMRKDSKLPCFQKFDMKVFRGRFKETLTDDKRTAHIESLVRESMNSKRTVWYDEFQKLTNGYEP